VHALSPLHNFPHFFSAQKILILGGTAFLGPPVVERALARGHQVTLFNRGKTGTDLIPSAEKFMATAKRGISPA
jgi:nucleoside-diphosphate-sugar epimerase